PQRVWELFHQEVHWPTGEEETQLPAWCREFGGTTGGACRCRLGKVAVEVYDLGRPPQIIGPTEILALFAFDDGRMKKTLFGLGGGTHDGRRLLLAYDAGRFILREYPPSNSEGLS